MVLEDGYDVLLPNCIHPHLAVVAWNIAVALSKKDQHVQASVLYGCCAKVDLINLPLPFTQLCADVHACR